jgi:DNA-binding transcriptional LysR family regulator
MLAAFRAEHPGVDLTVRHAGGSAEMAREVRDGRLDLAFVALPGGAFPGLELVPLASEPIVLVVAAGHALASGRDVELAALRDETLVDLPVGWGTRMAVDRSFAAAGVSRTIAYEVNDTATMVEFIREGLAVGLLPRSFVEATGDIAFVPVRAHPPPFETAIAIPANRRLSAATRALLATIERHRRNESRRARAPRIDA